MTFSLACCEQTIASRIFNFFQELGLAGNLARQRVLPWCRPASHFPGW